MPTFLKATEIPTRGARTLLGSWYTSPAVYEREVERIFLERWLCACRAAEIANAGDFVVRRVGAESVIVTRDESGNARAFYNVCRHRGTRICEEARGHFEEGIQCPYHAWTYALDGRLIGAPHMRGLEGFDPADYPLHAAPVRRMSLAQRGHVAKSFLRSSRAGKK